MSPTGPARFARTVTLGLVLGCGGTNTPPPGQVMLVLETNGGAGTTLDFARLDVVVTDARAGGQILKSYSHSPSRLPGTIALVAGSGAASQTKLEVFATDANGALRIYQAAKLTIPSEGASMLRMKLDVACDAVVPNVACPGASATCAASARIACPPEHACLSGRCIPVHEFGGKDLPAYDPGRAASCEAESEAQICARRAIGCGSYVLTDTCGSPQVARCGTCAGEDTATTAKRRGAGLDDCGAIRAEDCARSAKVAGGAFHRGEDSSYPASIHEYRLDNFEVTVGRFRAFLDAWIGGWRPTPGSGRHAHLRGGAGLSTTTGGNETGWDATWTAYVGAPSVNSVVPTGAGATTQPEWASSLTCSGLFSTWTGTRGPGENRPQTCLSRYDAYAFCIWDGGFLPSEAEWEYAAAGGSEERIYPWGTNGPAANAFLAAYGCYYSGTGTCSSVTSIAPVGAIARGAAKWGHSDLAGNVWEWNSDWYQTPYAARCDDCTNAAVDSFRVTRGGSFDSRASSLLSAGRSGSGPAFRAATIGGRCARSP